MTPPIRAQNESVNSIDSIANLLRTEHIALVGMLSLFFPANKKINVSANYVVKLTRI